MLRTRSLLKPTASVQLACVRRTASVHPEPGSNSPMLYNSSPQRVLSRKKCEKPLSSSGSRREKPTHYARNNRLWSGAVSANLSFRRLAFLRANSVAAPVGVDSAEVFPKSLGGPPTVVPCTPPAHLGLWGRTHLLLLRTDWRSSSGSSSSVVPFEGFYQGRRGERLSS